MDLSERPSQPSGGRDCGASSRGHLDGPGPLREEELTGWQRGERGQGQEHRKYISQGDQDEWWVGS